MSVASRSDYELRDRRIFRRVVLWGFLLFLALLIALPSGIGPIFRLFTVPANSMAPSLPIGSFVVASRISYGYGRYSFDSFNLPIEGRWPRPQLPEPGDVVAFRLPHDPKIFYIKRIAGVPGDRIQMIGGIPNINGVPIKRERAEDQIEDTKCGSHQVVHVYRETLPNGRSYLIRKLSETCSLGRFSAADDTGVFVVPPDHYFMLGDNRDDSADSRFAAGNGSGYVHFELILGRILASF